MIKNYIDILGKIFWFFNATLYPLKMTQKSKIL